MCQSTIDILVYHRTEMYGKSFAPDPRGYVYHRNWGVKYAELDYGLSWVSTGMGLSFFLFSLS